MPKHVFFDLDNTLMRSRTEMAPEHRPFFKELCDKADVIVVSGAQASQVRVQIPASIGASFYILGQTGNQALAKDGTVIWKDTFNEEQTRATLVVIEKMKSEFDPNVKDPNDLVELRGSQISYSPIGHNEDVEKKYAFDPGNKRRLAIISKYEQELAELKRIGVDVVPGGTTCFDFFLAGHTKGFNIARLIEHEKWDKRDCVYVGDALFPGGNDETVIGVIPTHAIKDPQETFEFIANTLAS